MTILLVTWLLAGQPPHSYQVRFETPAACEAARARVAREPDRVAGSMIGQGYQPAAISISAICVAES